MLDAGFLHIEPFHQWPAPLLAMSSSLVATAVAGARPPSRKVEQLRRQVRRNSNGRYEEDDCCSPISNVGAGGGADFTFEDFFTGHFDVIAQPRIVVAAMKEDSTSLPIRRSQHDQSWEQNVALLTTVDCHHSPAAVLSIVDREEAEFFPPPPTNANYLWSDDSSSSSPCESTSSTPPPQRLCDAFQLSLRLYLEDVEPSHPLQCADAAAVAKASHQACEGGINQAPVVLGVSSAVATAANWGMGSPLNIHELFESCDVAHRAGTPGNHAVDAPSVDHALVSPPETTTRQSGAESTPVKSLEALREPDDNSPLPVCPQSDDNDRTANYFCGGDTSPSPVTAVLLDVMQNVDRFSWFDLEDDEVSPSPEHASHRGRKLAADDAHTPRADVRSTLSFVHPVLNGFGTRPAIGPSYSPTQYDARATSPTGSIAQSFRGSLADFSIGSSANLGHPVVSPIVRCRPAVAYALAQPDKRTSERREMATQTSQAHRDSITPESLACEEESTHHACTAAFVPAPLSSSTSHPRSSRSTSTSSEADVPSSPLRPHAEVHDYAPEDDRAAPAALPAESPQFALMDESYPTTPLPLEQTPSASFAHFFFKEPPMLDEGSIGPESHGTAFVQSH